MVEFVLLVAALVAALFIRYVYHNGWKALRTREGRGVLFGLFVAPAVALALVLIAGCSSHSVRVVAALDHTFDQSPMCEQGGASDRLTSNLELKYTSVISADGRTHLQSGYRHHSCAISKDAESYDGVYLGVERELWGW